MTRTKGYTVAAVEVHPQLSGAYVLRHVSHKFVLACDEDEAVTTTLARYPDLAKCLLYACEIPLWICGLVDDAESDNICQK